jgi:HEAT repeat protein
MIRITLCAWIACAAVVAQEATSRDKIRMARELTREGSVAIPKLQPLLSDPDIEVRNEAVKATVEIGTQHSLNPLIQATSDPDVEIQIRATDGLVNFYLPGYLQTGLAASIRRAGTAIKSRWTDTNDQVIDRYVQARDDVVIALGKLARGGASMDSRANAARAVGILRGAAAIPDLVEALRSKDDKVIYEVLVALQKINDSSAAPKIAFLLRDLNEKVQIAALETTGLLQNKAALPDLKQALARARSDKIRRAALTAIAMLPDPSSRQIYVQYFNAKDDALRAAAAEGFGRLGDPRDLAMLDTAFNDERKVNPRLSQAFALVALGRTDTADNSPLTYLVDRLNSSAYKAVAQAFLVELARKPEVRAQLYTALPRSTKDEKIMLAHVLAGSGDRDTLPHLEKISRDPDTEVAQEGIRALRNLKTRMIK